MEQHKLESLLIDYIDGKLNAVDKHFIEQELLKNPNSFRLYEQLKEVMQAMDRREAIEPSTTVKDSFNAMLEQEIRQLPKARTVKLNPWWYRVAAAAAFLLIGVSVGLWIDNHRQRQQEIALANMERQRVQQAVSMISDTDSPGQRILGVKAALDGEDTNTEILRVLIRTLNEDPNTNVRMAALDGLRRFYHEPLVQKALIHSLTAQTDPVIQINLIQILVEMKEKGAVESLQKIIEQQDLIPAVKDEAQMGVLVLS